MKWWEPPGERNDKLQDHSFSSQSTPKGKNHVRAAELMKWRGPPGEMSDNLLRRRLEVKRCEERSVKSRKCERGVD